MLQDPLRGFRTEGDFVERPWWWVRDPPSRRGTDTAEEGSPKRHQSGVGPSEKTVPGLSFIKTETSVPLVSGDTTSPFWGVCCVCVPTSKIRDQIREGREVCVGRVRFHRVQGVRLLWPEHLG